MIDVEQLKKDEFDENFIKYLEKKDGKIIKFKCTLCDEIFEDEGDLGMHLMWTHNLAEEVIE